MKYEINVYLVSVNKKREKARLKNTLTSKILYQRP